MIVCRWQEVISGPGLEKLTGQHLPNIVLLYLTLLYLNND
jgi:hypothetical protein